METCIEQTAFQLQDGALRVDLSNPVGLPVRGVNERTGEVKNYILRVTVTGKLVLQ